MRSEKTGAFLLMAIVILWAAMPAFACVQAVPAHRACCGLMRDCHSSTTMSGRTCCIARPQAELVQPGTPGANDGAPLLTATAEAPEMMVPPIARASAFVALGNSPPGQSPGAPSILRI